MKQGWQIKHINELSVSLDSKRVPITKHIRNNGEIPYYGASGIVDYVEDYLFDEDSLLVSEDGANLLTRTYPIAFSISGKTWVNNHAHVLRFENSFTQKFVEMFLNSIRLDDFVSGMAQPKLNQTMLNKIPIPLPAHLEQIRIINILNNVITAIDKAKANAKQNLKNAKELFESYLQSVFENNGDDWEEKKIIEVCEIKPQKQEARDKLRSNDFVTFLPMEDLGVLNKEIVGVKERQFKDVSGSYTYFANNDVLLAKITPCFENGKIGIARNLVNGIGFGSSEYIVFRVQEKIETEYLYYFLSRNAIREEGKRYMSGAVGHKRVSKDWIENYVIAFPKSKNVQQTIVQKLDALSTETKKLDAIYKKKLEDLEELKKSILQKASMGEL